jgi:phosphatidylethanolamine-binding protein (PEBP) family uncharacterized protein
MRACDLPRQAATSPEPARQGKAGRSGPRGTRRGVNDCTMRFASDKTMSGNYHGCDARCPPWNDSIVHYYVFTRYALDEATRNVVGIFNVQHVQAAIRGRVLAEAAAPGRCRLNPDVKA